MACKHLAVDLDAIRHRLDVWEQQRVFEVELEVAGIVAGQRGHGLCALDGVRGGGHVASNVNL